MRFKFTTLIVLIFAVGVITSSLAYDERIIKPIRSPDDILLTPSVYEKISKLDETEQQISYSTYVAGFLDAVVLQEAEKIQKNPSYSLNIKQFLEECQGMSIGQLADTMLMFYKENPQWRDMKPVIVLISVIPRLRKGLPPIPALQEE